LTVKLPPDKAAEAVLFYAKVFRWPSFPVPPGTKKSHTCADRSRSGRRWGAERDPKILERYWRRWWNANIGIPTGVENGFFVIDCDTPEGHDVDGIRNFAALVHHHRPLPPTLTAVSPTGSRHLYFQYPDGRIVCNSEGKAGRGLAPGVDVRGEGGMVLAPPSKKSLKDGRRYTWVNWGTPIAAAPEWLLKLVTRKPRVKRRRTAPVNPQRELALIEAALDVIARECARTGDWPYRLWFEVGCALHYELGDAGFDLFDEWSSRSPTYAEEDVVKKWEHVSQIDAFKIGTVFHFASEANPRWRVEFEAKQWQQTVMMMRRRA
jgi:Bifunctional DNA primase/polymerase, N-terminal/Primase C terminal 2 (PriCT-2)